MLDNNDKRYIKQLLEESLRDAKIGKTKSTKSNSATSSKDSFKNSISETYNVLKYNKTITSAKDALMYSNPITALIAENWDLAKLGFKASSSAIKGTSSLLKKLYNRKNKKQKNKNRLLPTISEMKDSSMLESARERYIKANKVLLNNGNNYINCKQILFNINGMNAQKFASKNKLFSGFKPLLPDRQEDVTAIEQKSTLMLTKKSEKDNNIIEMTKGINGIYSSSKEATKILTMINKRAILITTGILLGVAGITALAIWLKNKFGDRNATPVPNASENINSWKGNQDTKQAEKISQLTSSINKETKVSGPTGIDKFGLSGDKWYTPSSGYKIKSNAGAPYRAPFDLKVLSWTENQRNVGNVDITVERLSKSKRNAVIMNVSKPTVVPGDIIKKGEIIGEVPELGEVFVKDINLKEANVYSDMLNKYANRSEQEKQNEISELSNKMSAKQSDKVRNAFGALKTDKLKKSSKYAEGAVPSAKISEKDIKDYSKNYAFQGLAAEDLQQHEAEMYAKPKFNIFNRKPKDNLYGEGNKNLDKAKSQYKETNKKSKPEKVSSLPVKAPTMTKIPEAERGSIIYGLNKYEDIANANAGLYAIKSC